MMKELLEKASLMVAGLVRSHSEEIENAYLKEEDGGVSIGLKITIEPGQSIGTKKVTTSISFVESRVKDQSSETFDDNQLQLDYESDKKPAKKR